MGIRPVPSSVGASRGARSRYAAVTALGLALSAGCATSPPPAAHPESAETGVVARAATPFTAQVGSRTLTPAQTDALLLSKPVLCVGESHTDAGHHWVQWRVIERVGKAAQARGERFAVGFEMFDQSQQPALDQRRAGRLDHEAFVAESGYEKRWGFDYELYRPLLDAALASGGELLALNAPKDWTRQVARQGLTGISAELRSQLPELVLDVPEHRAFFDAAMRHHPPHPAPAKATPTEQGETVPESAGQGEMKPERGAHGDGHSHAHGDGHSHAHGDGHSHAHGDAGEEDPLAAMYAAQVVWDETMAERAAKWFAAAPRRSRLVIVAGMGHCHRTAIPERFERRVEADVLSLRPIRRSELNEPQLPASDQFDALLVMER